VLHKSNCLPVPGVSKGCSLALDAEADRIVSPPKSRSPLWERDFADDRHLAARPQKRIFPETVKTILGFKQKMAPQKIPKTQFPTTKIGLSKVLLNCVLGLFFKTPNISLTIKVLKDGLTCSYFQSACQWRRTVLGQTVRRRTVMKVI